MLTVSNLVKNYRGAASSVPAVDRVSFRIGEGEFYTLLGPSGCGKTTTLRCVAGLEQPDAGVISIGGEVVSDPVRGIHVPTHRRSIGMVFQSYAIWPHLDVFGNVAFPLQVAGERLARAEIHDRVREALVLVGMEEFLDRPAPYLSGGQQQRVALARALVRRPELLLLDEPLSNLDAKLRERMRDELQELVSRVAITTLYVTHDQVEALALSDRIAIMAAGGIVQEGEPQSIYLSPKDSFVASFLGVANVIAATVDSSAKGVQLQNGTHLGLTVPPGLRDGRRVRLVFRPEDTRLHGEPPAGQTGLVGMVEKASFLGSHVEYKVRISDSIVRVYAHPSEKISENAQVWLTISDGRALVFPADAS